MSVSVPSTSESVGESLVSDLGGLGVANRFLFDASFSMSPIGVCAFYLYIFFY